MNDLEDFRESIASTFEAVSAMGDAQRRFAEESDREIKRLWADNAELRDEINAVSNRLEALTRARLAEPAEVAGAIVSHELRRRLSE